MSDCPESGHSHELEYKNNFRILSDERVAQSCYCTLCEDEMRRVYICGEFQSIDKDNLTEVITVDDGESVLRKVES